MAKKSKKQRRAKKKKDIHKRHKAKKLALPELLRKEPFLNEALGYLESDSISDVPFRRVARKFPHNFNKVISYYRDQEGFFSDQIDDLMMELKPKTFGKLPGIVAVLDSEMSRLSRMAKE